VFQLQGAKGVDEGVPEALGQVAFRAASREAGAEQGGGERLVRQGPLVRGERSGPHQSSRVGMMLEQAVLHASRVASSCSSTQLPTMCAPPPPMPMRPQRSQLPYAVDSGSSLAEFPVSGSK
jgi:hypothetical protein